MLFRVTACVKNAKTSLRLREIPCALRFKSERCAASNPVAEIQDLVVRWAYSGYENLAMFWQYLICGQLWSWFFHILHEGGSHWSFSYSHIISLQSVFQCSFNFRIGYFIAKTKPIVSCGMSSGIPWERNFWNYMKQGLDLRADQKKVPNNNHENLVCFLSKCTLAGLLCSRMLNCCRWSPPPAAATSGATANANAPARPRRHRAGLVPAAKRGPPASSAVATPPPQ